MAVVVTLPGMTTTASPFPRLIVAFSGYLRSGKNAAADPLIEDGAAQASFAAKLKAFLVAVDPLIVQHGVTYRLSALVSAYGMERCKDEYPEVRALLQRCGTEAGRRILGEDVWVDAVMGDLPEQDVVFTDCRFPNEADAVKAAGGFVVRVVRPGHEPGPDAHPSEAALDGYPFDVVITNDGTLEDLHARVRSAVIALRGELSAYAAT